MLTLAAGLFVAIVAHSQDRLVGGDLSMLPKYEAANVAYFDQSGNLIPDVLKFVKDEAGFNVVRIRLFVTPTGETGVVQDLDYVAALARRVKAEGMKVLLDFHYSDIWADPKGQWTPSLWKGLDDDALIGKIAEYTTEVLTCMNDESATPDYIQIGNEISFGMLWGSEGDADLKKCFINSDDNWARFKNLLNSAAGACRAVCPTAKIIVHTERTADAETTQAIYSRLSDVDYDIIALSYYPEWHNDVATLVGNLTNLQSQFPDKQLLVAEIGYCNNWYPTDATYDLTDVYPASPQGQKKFLSDVVDGVKDIDNLIGLIYWFPEENPVNNHVYEPWFNHGLFNPTTGKVSDALFELKRFLDDGSVDEIVAEQNGERQYFDILGRKVDVSNGLQSGIYISNGKKLIVR